MKEYIFKINYDNNLVDEFVKNHPLSNMYQISNWAKMKPSWSSFNAVLLDQDKIVASALVLVRSKYKLKLAYIPRGPIMDYNNKILCQTFLQQLHNYCKSIGIISVIFDPNVIVNNVSIKDKDIIDNYDDSLYLNNICLPYIHFKGHTKSIEDTTLPRYGCRFIFDDVDIVDHFDKKTKEKVFHYLDNGLQVVNSKDTHLFYEMIHYTESRKGIALRNEQYFTDLLSIYPNSTLLFAYINFSDILLHLNTLKHDYQSKINLYKDSAPKKSKQWQIQINRLDKEINETIQLQQKYNNEKQLVSALLLVNDGKTCELLYSGLNEDFRKYHPAYALRYKGLCWARVNGCQSFNFGGVEGDLNDGLFTFKSSFNPNIDVYLGEFIMACNPLNIIFEKGIPALRKYRDKKISKEKKMVKK